MVLDGRSDLFRSRLGESIDEHAGAVSEHNFEGIVAGGGGPDGATDVACGDGVGVGGVGGVGGLPAEARGVETQTALVF